MRGRGHGTLAGLFLLLALLATPPDAPPSGRAVALMCTPRRQVEDTRRHPLLVFPSGIPLS